MSEIKIEIGDNLYKALKLFIIVIDRENSRCDEMPRIVI